MKNSKKFIHFFVVGKLLVTVLFLCVNFDSCDKPGGSLMEPQFAPLQEGQGSYYACIYDDGSISKIKDISFYGQTNIGGIRRESDDSVNRLELSTVKEIVVKQPAFESMRFSDREYMLVSVEYATGTIVEDLLFPKHVIICGVEEDTGMKRSWFLHKLEKIVIDCKRMPQQAVHQLDRPQREISPTLTSMRHRTADDRALEQDVMEKKVNVQANVPVPEEETPKDKTMFEAFLGIIDAVIDFFKAIFHFITRFIAF
jgi:hypothetical protein